MTDFEYDVALSFAGEDRDLVKKVVSILEASDVRLFYDEFDEAALWGEDLVEYFTDLYRRKARFMVMFASEHYAKKAWTRVERRTALARAMSQVEPYILPVRLDETEIPGILPTISEVDARSHSPMQIASLIHEKLGLSRVSDARQKLNNVPRSDEELRLAFEQRPEYWEFWTFAGQLYSEWRRLDAKLRDQDMKFGTLGARQLTPHELPSYVSSEMDTLKAIIENLNNVLNPAAQLEAFGPHGVSGNSAAIVHLARRIAAMAEQMLDWAAEVRSIRGTTEMRTTLRCLSEFVDQPLKDFKAFIDDFAEQLEANLPGHGPDKEPLQLTMELKPTLNSAVTDRFNAMMVELVENAK